MGEEKSNDDREAFNSVPFPLSLYPKLFTLGVQRPSSSYNQNMRCLPPGARNAFCRQIYDEGCL